MSSGDSQSLDRLSLKMERDQTNTFAKGLPGSAFSHRTMFGRSRHHHARADDSAGLPRLFLWSFLLSRLDLKKKNITWALRYCWQHRLDNRPKTNRRMNKIHRRSPSRPGPHQMKRYHVDQTTCWNSQPDKSRILLRRKKQCGQLPLVQSLEFKQFRMRLKTKPSIDAQAKWDMNRIQTSRGCGHET